MDGSMIGANLGVNPSLTITALSEHVCSRIPAKETAAESAPERETVGAGA
jgi:cholesterol oxidase